jgi:hypothetical protein
LEYEIERSSGMTFQPLDIAVIKGKWYNPMDWIIYQRTSTLWGHCVILKNESGDIFDPRGRGIENNHISRYATRGFKIRRYKNDFDKKKVMDWLVETQKVSHSYDFFALLGFITGIKEFQDEDHWYCAELPYWMLQRFPETRLTDEELAFVYPAFFMQCNDFVTVE